MNRSEYARGSVLLEEALTVLFCLVDDFYQNINPNGRRYESLKKLSDSEIITLALFQQLRASRANARSCETPSGSSRTCSPGWLVCTLPRSTAG